MCPACTRREDCDADLMRRWHESLWDPDACHGHRRATTGQTLLRVTATCEKKAPRSLSMTGARPREQYFHTCVAPYQKIQTNKSRPTSTCRERQPVHHIASIGCLSLHRVLLCRVSQVLTEPCIYHSSRMGRLSLSTPPAVAASLCKPVAAARRGSVQAVRGCWGEGRSLQGGAQRVHADE